MRRLWFLVVLAGLLGLGAVRSVERVDVNIIATSDLHGYLLPFDYYANRPANRGLAKDATIIKRLRKIDPEALLIDCGDVIEGSPMADVYAKSGKKDVPNPAANPAPNPMMLAMSELQYDAMVVGNHEFNFGVDFMLRAKAEAKFPWIAANILPVANEEEAIAVHNKNFVAAGQSMEERVLLPLTVESIHGVTVAVIGLTTPAIPNFERPENIEHYQFISALDAAKEWVKYAHETRKADVVIIAAHLGLERGLDDATPFPSQLAGENQVYEIAQKVPGIDGIVFGHTHQELAGKSVNGVILLQPKFWGQSVGHMTISLERGEAGKWKVVEKTSEVIPVTMLVESDPAIEKIAKPYHDAAQKYLDTPVAESKQLLETRLGRIIDTPAIEAIQQVQLAEGKADVSMSAVFDTGVRIPAGPVTVRQLAALYPYENTLVVVEATGEMLKAALEHAAEYFGNPQKFGYDYDAAAGVTYKIDVTKPVGQRIVDLRWKGEPLQPSQKLRLAINSYRKAGGGGYAMYRDAKVLSQSTADIRQLMIDYYTTRKVIDLPAASNWEIIPESARKALIAKPQ